LFFLETKVQMTCSCCIWCKHKEVSVARKVGGRGDRCQDTRKPRKYDSIFSWGKLSSGLWSLCDYTEKHNTSLTILYLCKTILEKYLLDLASLSFCLSAWDDSDRN
jgi:hypothetical protein